MSKDPIFDRIVTCTRAAVRHTLPSIIKKDHSFVMDLGFDSMSIARLALALEDEFDQAILLDDWIAQQADPTALTVSSLCHYVVASREDYEPATV